MRSSVLGVLPVALALFGVVVERLGALVFRGAALRERLLGGGVLALAYVACVVRGLGAIGWLAPAPLLALLAAAALSLAALGRRSPDATTPRGGAMFAALRAACVVENLPLVLAGVIGLTVACAAARLLPIWQWDALGYHLPYVAFALQDGTLASVPPDVPYLSTYPHVVEWFFIAWRAMLPDDRLVDAAQIPFGLFGALGVGALARAFGAKRPHAAAAAVAWLTLPAVFLQLPTNYVDVASAALLLAAIGFVLAEPTTRNVVVAGVALGLFLGSKPNAPVATVFLALVLIVRAVRAGRRGAVVVALALVALLGAESYLVNLARHGNPIWPVEAHLGPITLPGLRPMSYLLESGAAAPRASGWGPIRVLRAWATLSAPPAFDMRLGGLGLVFLGALPLAVMAAFRRRSWPLLAVTLATLASPDPAVPRYVLAFPGLVLALAVSDLERFVPVVRRWGVAVAGLAAGVELVRASPGLAGEGPPLAAYLAMDDGARARAVGADGPPGPYLDLHRDLAAGDRLAFDASLDLFYLAWPSDQGHRALYVPDAAPEALVERVVHDPSVRVLVADDLTRLGWRAQDTFRPAFHCRTTACTVYVRR